MITTLKNKKSQKNANTITLAATQASRSQPSAVIDHSENTALNKYIRNIRAMNKKTAYEYYLRLNNFQDFIIRSYNITLDDIVTKMKGGLENPYEVLSGYVSYLQTGYNISTSTIKERVITAKNFFEFYDVDISPRKFKLKVKMPKVIRKNKEALSKEDITDILNMCSDIRLKHILCY